MIEGRIRKFLEEIVLLDQIFVIDGKTKISDVVAALAKELGTSVELKSYVRFERGEGIEKEEKTKIVIWDVCDEMGERRNIQTNIKKKHLFIPVF